MIDSTALAIDDLSIQFPVADGPPKRVVRHVSLDVKRGQVLGLVGESGSGKTMIALATLGLIPAPGRTTTGRVVVNGSDIRSLSEKQLRALRGNKVGIIFQDPLSALNPVKPIGKGLIESAMRHSKCGRSDASLRAVDLLKAVGIPNAAERLYSYPHEFSGGQRQRIMIALAVINRPSLIVADEPTTALDATIQIQILDLLRSYKKNSGLLLITHDLGVAADICDDIAVMREGEITEYGSVEQILTEPRESYTRNLIDAVPTFDSPARVALSRTGQKPQPLLSVRDLTVSFRVGRRSLKALDSAGFHLDHGETLGVVGESGSGKSTLARALLRALKPSHGEIEFDGIDISHIEGEELRNVRRRMQFVFQDPYASLDPRWTIGRSIAEPLRAQGVTSQSEIASRVAELIEQVGLPADTLRRYPAEFSGGQRQRICIARALILRPDLLIADEPVSSLDVTIQRQVVDLIKDLQSKFSIALMLIAHDLPLVYQIANRLLVLYLGEIVEEGSTEDVLTHPLHPYTVALVSSTLTPKSGTTTRRLVLKGESPSALEPPSGCRFHTRCPIAKPKCAEIPPPFTAPLKGRRVACHFPGEVSLDRGDPGHISNSREDRAIISFDDWDHDT